MTKFPSPCISSLYRPFEDLNVTGHIPSSQVPIDAAAFAAVTIAWAAFSSAASNSSSTSSNLILAASAASLLRPI